MAGHSHWAGIKHKKAINDQKKGKVFTKLARLIYVAVKEGGGPDADMNPRLRLILDKCRLSNMPKDNVKRAIDKASGAGGESYEQFIYEGYAPGGVAIMIDCMSDNRNRTFPEVKNLVTARNGSLGSPGCVSYMFSRKGVITVPEKAIAEDALMELVLEAGAEDLESGDGYHTVTTPFEAFEAVKKAIEAKSLTIDSAEVRMVPSTTVSLSVDDAKKVLALIEALEDHDDVNDVYHNLEMTDELAAAMD